MGDRAAAVATGLADEENVIRAGVLPLEILTAARQAAALKAGAGSLWNADVPPSEPGQAGDGQRERDGQQPGQWRDGQVGGRETRHVRVR
jgi:hypothetical protein